MDAKRGFVPEDERNFSPEAIEILRTASRHILFLLDEGYDLKQASTFVGNHFLLSERQRLAIVRSLASGKQLSERKKKLLPMDQPVSNSGRLKARIADIAEETGCSDLDIQILRDVDRTLYDKELVITSDSVILDHCRSWVNLTAECVKQMGFPIFQVW